MYSLEYTKLYLTWYMKIVSFVWGDTIKEIKKEIDKRIEQREDEYREQHKNDNKIRCYVIPPKVMCNPELTVCEYIFDK